MFRFPDFFKVGIAESGNHDQRDVRGRLGRALSGPARARTPDGTDNYDVEANQNFAKNLKGQLLLAHGTMDNNVPPYNTMLVADALIKANKDFDLLMIPNAGHGYGAASNYMMRRRWDYLREVADRRRAAEGVPHRPAMGSERRSWPGSRRRAASTGRLRGVSAVSPAWRGPAARPAPCCAPPMADDAGSVRRWLAPRSSTSATSTR